MMTLMIIVIMLPCSDLKMAPNYKISKFLGLEFEVRHGGGDLMHFSLGVIDNRD